LAPWALFGIGLFLLGIDMSLFGFSQIYLGFIKPHAELESLCKKTHHFRTSEGKELVKARVVHLGYIKLLLGLDRARNHHGQSRLLVYKKEVE
jgi:hypothetical protein